MSKTPRIAPDAEPPRGTPSDDAIDRALADSFPASDPLPWTLGIEAEHDPAAGDRDVGAASHHAKSAGA